MSAREDRARHGLVDLEINRHMDLLSAVLGACFALDPGSCLLVCR